MNELKDKLHKTVQKQVIRSLNEGPVHNQLIQVYSADELLKENTAQQKILKGTLEILQSGTNLLHNVVRQIAKGVSRNNSAHTAVKTVGAAIEVSSIFAEISDLETLI